MTAADYNAGEIECLLEAMLRASEEYDPDGGQCFSFRKFFSNWFRRSGSAYYFLFRKNLGVTNIQFAELVGLIRSHATPVPGNGPIHNLQFMSVSEFKDTITSLVEAFPQDSKTPELRYKTIASLYSQIIRQHVVLDCFYGSCAVFVPPQLTLDLEAVCAYSGYIQSCGRALYIRNIEKATTSEFYKVIENYTEPIPPDSPVFFSVYTHEDFTDYDREKKENLRHGLDDVKVYVEKFYIGSERLVSVLNEMRQRFKIKLRLPSPGSYSEQRARLQEQTNLDRSRTVWLLIDRSSGKEVHKGARRYLICYEQQFINENPFYLFDENKPAWIGPLTIPHTLLSAMINIAEPMRQVDDDDVMLADPFVGTGTTWLEAQKYSLLKPVCSDLADITPLLVKDNLEFFLAPHDKLHDYERSLDYIASPPDQRHAPRFVEDIDRPALDRSYDWVIDFLDEISSPNTIPRDLYSFTLSAREVKKLEKRTPLERILFYLALRTILRNIGGFERGAAKWEEIYRKEAKVLGFQIGRLRDLKRRQDEAKRFDQDYCVLQGSYSQSCTINFHMLADARDELRSVKVLDARKLKKKSYDIIITDPPYGFNTEDDIQALAQLYTEIITIMINALKEEGQLVMCLPDRSHTGRRLPFFALKELVIRQVLTIAEQLRREIIIPAYSVPQLSDLFRPPYYWESERALRRAILHFRIRELSHS